MKAPLFRLFSCFLLIVVGCSSDEKNRMQKPITTNLEKKAFVPHTTQNVITKALTEEEIAERKAEAQRNAIENRLAYYSKAFKDVIFYENENNCMILSTPDANGKGQGMIGELGGLLPTFYDFHYTIDLKDLSEDEISCRMDKYDSSFTVEINGKKLYFRTKGNLEILRGEKDAEAYKSFLKRVKNINEGKEVYGNPKYRITISD